MKSLVELLSLEFFRHETKNGASVTPPDTDVYYVYADRRALQFFELWLCKS